MALAEEARVLECCDGIALRVTGACKTFPAMGSFPFLGSTSPVVNNVSFSIKAQEVFALVGPSGAGKSTVGRIILGLIKPDSGSVSFYGQPLDHLLQKNARWFRHNCQAIFQDPKASLSPRFKVRELLIEALLSNDEMDRQAKQKAILEGIARVGLEKKHLDRFPYQLSGGEAQRVCIARAFIRKPLFVVCDEPTSSLDLATEYEIIQLLKELKIETNLTLFFISHNTSLIRQLADTVGIMQQGCLIAVRPTELTLSRSSYQENEAWRSKSLIGQSMANDFDS
jgi:peptide/nickel transport system ATP-binding protein